MDKTRFIRRVFGLLKYGESDIIIGIISLFLFSMVNFISDNQIILEREKLKNANIDIGGKTLIIGFNEPRFKKIKKSSNEVEIDSKLNARFVSYFLPAVEIARKQVKRPRLYVMSGINMALKWNAENEEQKKIMLANNAIKIDFLKVFFDTYFSDAFSLVEYVVPQDILKVPESKFLSLWKLIEKKYPKEIKKIKFQLIKFLYPKQFNVKNYSQLNAEQKLELARTDASLAFKYAIGHLFALGDINFEGNYIHNPKGYASIGGESEEFFNIVRSVAYEVLKDFGEIIFDREVFVFDNYKIVLKNKFKVPPPYSGMFGGDEFLEATYENGRGLDFYDSQPKLKDQMDYMYKNIISRDEYQKFWNSYKNRYFDLKNRYKEAYEIGDNW